MSSGHNISRAKRASTQRRAVAASTGKGDSTVSAAARSFLDLFYPVHYKIGIGIEDSLRGGRLSRHQVAILWLIRSEGEGGRSIQRKDIERSITRWFEIGNSAISKALRAMARPPLELLQILEHPLSGRERQVVLIDTGLQEIDRMVDQGRRFIQTMVDHLTDDEAAQGVHFLSRVSEIIDLVQATSRGGSKGTAAGGGRKEASTGSRSRKP